MSSTLQIELRPWQPGDVAPLAAIANNRKIWRNMTNRFPFPYTREAAEQWIRVANERPRDQRHFAVLVDDQVAGGAGFTRLDDLATRSAEIGYWLGEPWWGQGIAGRALAHATEVAFRDYDFVRLQANVLAWNPRSCRVLEKAGYTCEARLARAAFKDNEICDLLLYAMLRPEATAT